MGPRPTREVIENLRITLQKLEQNFDPVEDEPAMTELKRTLLLRIAELELAESLGSVEREPSSTPEPAEILPAATMTPEKDQLKEVPNTPLSPESRD